MNELKPKMKKTTLTAIKDKEEKEIRHISKIRRRVEGYYEKLCNSQQGPPLQTKEKMKRKVLTVNSEDPLK